jgi:hypothetical protein
MLSTTQTTLNHTVCTQPLLQARKNDQNPNSIQTPADRLSKPERENNPATNPSISSKTTISLPGPPTIPATQALTIQHCKGKTKQKQELKLKRETHRFAVRCWNYQCRRCTECPHNESRSWK